MSRPESEARLSSQLTALHQEMRDLRAAVETLTLKVEGSHLTPAEVITDPDKGVFLPGTGWTGSSATPPPSGDPVDDGLERARKLREQLRRPQ